MQSQKTSFIKRTGQGARREFQIMHLAVFPFQVEFLKPSDFPIIAYFEKGNQIIGVNCDSPILFAPGNKGDKIRLTSVKNTIRFHLYSQSNVVYKWSLYRQYPSGEEEFLESCAFNLREVVANYILPHRNQSNLSELPNDFHEKQLRGKFIMTGLILSFVLMLANDNTLIDLYVSQQYGLSASARSTSENVIDIVNGDIIKEELPVQDSFQSASMLSDISLLKNDSKPASQHSPPKEHYKIIVDSYIESQPRQEAQTEEIDFDNLIINGSNDRVVVIPPADINKNDKEDKVEQIENAELVEQKKDKYNSQGQLHIDQPKKLRHSNSRDYSLLKLDSDQGRQEPQEIDARLGFEEMALIDEENSIRDTTRLPVQLKQPVNSRKQRQKSGVVEDKSSVINEGINFKRIILLFVVVACLFLLAATYRYKFKKGKARLRIK